MSFAALQRAIDRRLARFFREKEAEYIRSKCSPVLLELHRQVKEFCLRGGKRLRPILMYYGYLAAGGKKTSALLDASISIELIHAYLLAHDDILDRDTLRRGGPTLHHAYTTSYAKRARGQAAHLGTCMGILGGDLLAVYGYEVLAGSDFPAPARLLATQELNRILTTVTEGQALDVIHAIGAKSATFSDVLRIMLCKTARYSTEGPLRLGAILGGAKPGTMRALSAYAIPLGIAFQIQDDALRLFGDETSVGKSASSDIQEGKQTILTVAAVRHGTTEQRHLVGRMLGRTKISPRELDLFRAAIRDSGALAQAQDLTANLILESRRAITGGRLPGIARMGLSDIIDYIEKRTS